MLEYQDERDSQILWNKSRAGKSLSRKRTHNKLGILEQSQYEIAIK